MRTKTFCFLITLVLCSCQINLPEASEFLPSENDVAILNSTKYEHHSAVELVFETEIVVLNSFYRGFDNDYLKRDDISLKGDGTYTIEAFEFIPFAAPKTPSTTILLIDQSGSYVGIDPYNTRSQSINKFLKDIKSPHTFLVGACSAQGKLSREPVEFSAEDSGNNLELNSRYLFELSKRTGGSNTIFDAASLAIDKLIVNGTSTRRELILLVHTNDENSLTTAATLISNAKLNDITIHVIVFGDEIDKDVFSRLSIDTGGLFVVCPTEKEITKTFNELERLINGERGVYRMRISYKPLQGSVQPGSVASHAIEILDPYTQKVYNPVFITVKIPS